MTASQSQRRCRTRPALVRKEALIDDTRAAHLVLLEKSTAQAGHRSSLSPSQAARLVAGCLAGAGDAAARLKSIMKIRPSTVYTHHLGRDLA